MAPAFLAVAIRAPLERLEERLRALAEAEGYLPESAADAVRVRAYLDDVLVRVPDTLAARVPAEAAAALAEVGGELDTAKTQVWRAKDGCPAGCQDWWVPAGLELFGALKGAWDVGKTIVNAGRVAIPYAARFASLM